MNKGASGSSNHSKDDADAKREEKKEEKKEKGDEKETKEEKKLDPETEKLQKALSHAIVTEKPNVKWDDVAGLHLAKQLLKEAVIMPIKYPQFFTGLNTCL